MQEPFFLENRLVVKINWAAERNKPMWKRRLQNRIKELRKYLSQLEPLKDKEISNVRHWQTFERKYSIRVKTLGVVNEELRKRVDRFIQNKMFQNNQRRLYRELNQER